MKEQLLKAIYSKLNEELREARANRQFYAALKLGILLNGTAFQSVCSKVIAEELNIQPSYAADIRKTKALWRMMQERGLRISQIQEK